MYQLTAFPDCIKRLADEAFIPTDEQNPDYQAYQQWLAAGNKPQPQPTLGADVPPVVVAGDAPPLAE